MNKFKTILISAIIAIILVIPVSAAETDTVTISVPGVSSGSIILFLVAEEQDGEYISLIEDYDFNDMSSDNYTLVASEILSSQQISNLSSFTAMIQNDGTATYSELESGIYIVALNGIAEDENGVEYEFEPYLLFVTEEESEMNSEAIIKSIDEEDYEQSVTVGEAIGIEDEDDYVPIAIIIVILIAAIVLICIFTISKRKRNKNVHEFPEQEDSEEDEYLGDEKDEE